MSTISSTNLWNIFTSFIKSILVQIFVKVASGIILNRLHTRNQTLRIAIFPVTVKYYIYI